jgi:hypothetical protein
MSRHLDTLAEQAGRDPKAILRASSLSLSEPMDQVRRAVEAMGDAGIDYLVCGWPGEGREQIEQFAREVVPEFAG